ncbi:hypothetical protein B0H12DRAFT_94785 [Mycena haematopus]|nr:hypothetical protein B0H12DRAFT_94785 [Mycena haematopus]
MALPIPGNPFDNYVFSTYFRGPKTAPKSGAAIQKRTVHGCEDRIQSTGQDGHGVQTDSVSPKVACCTRVVQRYAGSLQLVHRPGMDRPKQRPSCSSKYGHDSYSSCRGWKTAARQRMGTLAVAQGTESKVRKDWPVDLPKWNEGTAGNTISISWLSWIGGFINTGRLRFNGSENGKSFVSSDINSGHCPEPECPKHRPSRMNRHCNISCRRFAHGPSPVTLASHSR